MCIPVRPAFLKGKNLVANDRSWPITASRDGQGTANFDRWVVVRTSTSAGQVLVELRGQVRCNSASLVPTTQRMTELSSGSMTNTMKPIFIDTEVSMTATKRQIKPLIKPDAFAHFEAEAQRLAGRVSENQLRFLKVAKAKGKEMEPVGRMAGARS